MGSGRHRDWVIGYLFGFVFPPSKNTSQNLAGSGWEVFFINFEKWQLMASHGNIFIIFNKLLLQVFHQLKYINFV